MANLSPSKAGPAPLAASRRGTQSPNPPAGVSSLPASGSERGWKPQGFRMPDPNLYFTFLYSVVLLLLVFIFYTLAIPQS